MFELLAQFFVGGAFGLLGAVFHWTLFDMAVICLLLIILRVNIAEKYK